MSKDSVADYNIQLRNGIRQDLEGVKSKMSSELLVLVSSNDNGTVDRESSNFTAFKDSFLNADPKDKKNEGKAVISVLATEQTAFKKLEKSGLKETNPALYDEIRAEINSVRADLTSKLDSDKGVQDLLADFLKQKSMGQSPFQVLVTQKQGMYEVGDTRTMAQDEVKAFTNKLMPYVDFSSININALARDRRVVDQGIGPIIQQAMINNFGNPLPNNPNAYSLDEIKLTPEKAKEFGAEVSRKVADYSQQQAKLYDVMDEVFKQSEEKGTKFTPEQKKEITQALAPTLLNLGSEYLESKKTALTKDLVSSLKSEQSFSTRFTGNYKISPKDLENIAKKIDKTHQSEALKSSVKKVEELIVKYHMTDKDVATKVKLFAENNKIKGLKDHPSTEDIAKIRQSNPKQFDKIFGTPSSTKIVMSTVVLKEVGTIKRDVLHQSTESPAKSLVASPSKQVDAEQVKAASTSAPKVASSASQSKTKKLIEIFEGGQGVDAIKTPKVVPSVPRVKTSKLRENFGR